MLPAGYSRKAVNEQPARSGKKSDSETGIGNLSTGRRHLTPLDVM